MSVVAAERQAAIGAFVLGGLVLVLGAIVLFGNFRVFKPARYAAIVFQDSISGLSVGAPVTFRGVRVGAVEKIELRYDQKSHTAYIPVTVQLDPDRVHVVPSGEAGPGEINLASLIARGMRAELNTQSFVTGQSEIDLDFDSASPAVLHPDVTDLPEIPTRLSTLQRVTQSLSQLPLSELVANAGATLQSLRTLSERLSNDLPPLVASLQTTSDKTAHAADAATGAIADLQAHLDDTLAHITKLAASSDTEVNQRGADLHALLAATTQTVEQARAALADLRSLTSNRGTARANLEATLRDLAAASASLRGFASDVEHNPQLLLTGRRP